MFATLIAMPAFPQGAQGGPAQHDQHHPTSPPTSAMQPPGKPEMGMMVRQAQLDELLKKMNAAQGTAKTDAMAELLNVLVESHRTMCGPMMADMMSKMSMMKNMGDKGQAPPAADPQKQARSATSVARRLFSDVRRPRARPTCSTSR
jgi:hypothetical protein